MNPPIRPGTPNLDALFAAHPNGESRYTGDFDNALTVYTALKNGNVDVSSVPQSELDAAQQYLVDAFEYSKVNGGFMPGENPNEQPITLENDPAPATVTTTKDPAPIPVTIADVVAVPAAQPAAMTQRSTPDTHVTVHNDSVSLLHRLWGDVLVGVAGAEHLFEEALHHVFPHAS